jgi:antitoxin YefM
MYNINITQARSNLYQLVDMAIDDSEIVNISTKKGNAIIISAENYNAIQETLYLLNIKGMRESIIEGKETPISDCVGEDEVEF